MEQSRYFQVYNSGNNRWIKYDREKSGISECKKSPGKYKGVPVWSK